MDAGLPRGSRERAGPLLLCGALAAFALFHGGGSSYSSLVWLGVAVLLLAGAGLALAFWGIVPQARLTRLGLACIALLTGLVIWMGASVIWSVAPDRSWEYFNRGLVYTAFLCVGLLAGAWRPSLRLISLGFGVLSAAVIGWALLGKVIPDFFPDGARVARLRDPLGYWNALAVVAAFAILSGLWAASRREHPRWLRAGGAVVVFASTVALLLTYSRGGIVVTVLVVGALLWLLPERVQALATVGVALPPALAISIWAFTTDGLVGNGESYDSRLHAGLVLGGLLVAGGALVVAAALYLLRFEATHVERVRLPTRRQGLVAAVALAGVVVVVMVVGGWASRAVRDFTNPASIEGPRPGRVVSFSSSRRWDWWTESWHLFRRDPITGAGAGSFSVARRPFKTDLIAVIEPHSLPIQVLAETGLVGLALLLGALGTGVAAVTGALRRHAGAERAAGTVLALAIVAYLLHTLVDYDWDFVALTAVVLMLLGLLLTSGLPSGTSRRRPLLAGSALIFSIAAVVSVVSPWIADRKVDEAYAALDRGEPAAARTDADSARSWNPLAIEPLHAAAAAEEVRGNTQAALELYRKAVELQPQNPVAWYELARYEESVGLRDAAIRDIARAQQLDPKDEAIVQLIQRLFAPQ